MVTITPALQQLVTNQNKPARLLFNSNCLFGGNSFS